ncbi:hypothetical protein G6F29_002528 [Rhizopus arrhizus]|nr:hypothetical protein G6F23_008804 [Rhizopus arrhizus]KAG0755468.1 hypothetical protein G6F22_020598 [Rhizopus arrhizus]KAG0803642.1 hypothetical protein G6F20_013347 [Rhizopus arrhizus]KAG0835381.1 hypothetical protein G6F18_005864 [Rhizopus arrhizus]KAG0900094.1 hypothetical protein G6F34_004146 [Rhizopus arrhizus]
MLSVLIFFGLLSAFMLVSSLPLGPATLEKRLPDGIGGSLDSIPNIGNLLGSASNPAAPDAGRPSNGIPIIGNLLGGASNPAA